MSKDSWGDIIPFRSRGLGESPRAVTFGELAGEWLRTEGARLVRPEDAEKHVEHLKGLWALTEKEMRPSIAKQVLFALLRPEGHLSPTTVNKVMGTARRIIREAQFNEEWAGQNPFELIRKLKQVRPVMRPLSLSESRAMLPHLRPDRRREALAMLYLGLRPGELKALQREDVDSRTKLITVRRSNGRDSTKTGRARIVPIPDALWPTLEEALKASSDGCPLVFPGPSGERQREDAKLSKGLKTALGKAGLVTGYKYKCRRAGCGHQEDRTAKEELRCPECNFVLWAVPKPIKVRFYDLRHSAATLHREAGADPLAIQIILGHAAENLTDSVYTHLSAEYVRREVNKLKI